MEAGRLQNAQDAFIDETGLDFSFLFAIFQGASGYSATEDDCESYAETIGDPEFPVFADGDTLIADNTPMTAEQVPEYCGIAPDMTIISCDNGHGGYEDIIEDIKSHAGL
ncbi:MAG: hypothetical protein QGG40_18730 [Myxococcota bacterium]|nr:hypothetical protein [Myxococcota bacterium]